MSSKIFKSDIYRAFYNWEKEIEDGEVVEYSDEARDSMTLHDRALHLTDQLIRYLWAVKNEQNK